MPLTMKILHIISSGGMYGAEAVILNMSRTLNKGPHQSMLGVFSNSSQPNVQLHESALRQGIDSNLISCKGQIDRSVPLSIRHLAQNRGADVVHAHGYKADVYVHLALRKTRTPLVSTCHTWYDNNPVVRLYGALDRLVLRNYAGVVAVSDEVQQRLLRAGVPAHRVHLIRNGIDLQPFDTPRPSPEEQRGPDRPLLVGLVGRLATEKGVDLFLQAAKDVLVDQPSTRFVVLGDGPDRAKLEALIDHLSIRTSVSMPGRSENMPSVYASLDIMVSSSRKEGLPIAILEGMASGLPVVATAVGAVPSVVQDGRTGVLVPPENVGALKSAILGLLRDPMQRERYGHAGRRSIAENFSAERMSADYLALYQEVLAAIDR